MERGERFYNAGTGNLFQVRLVPLDLLVFQDIVNPGHLGNLESQVQLVLKDLPVSIVMLELYFHFIVWILKFIVSQHCNC